MRVWTYLGSIHITEERLLDLTRCVSLFQPYQYVQAKLLLRLIGLRPNGGLSKYSSQRTVEYEASTDVSSELLECSVSDPRVQDIIDKRLIAHLQFWQNPSSDHRCLIHGLGGSLPRT